MSYPAMVFFLLVVVRHGTVGRLRVDHPFTTRSFYSQSMLTLRRIEVIKPPCIPHPPDRSLTNRGFISGVRAAVYDFCKALPFIAFLKLIATLTQLSPSWIVMWRHRFCTIADIALFIFFCRLIEDEDDCIVIAILPWMG